MSRHIRLGLQVGGLFFISSMALLYMDQWMLKTLPNTRHLPLPLFSLLIMFALFLTVLFMLLNSSNQMHQTIAEYKAELQQARSELEDTKSNLEERVERRTFEISVANASLNREIAERIQAETETRRLKHQMELILDSAGEGIFGLDAQGNVSFVNKAASLMLGWSQKDLLGKSHHDLVHHTHGDGSDYPVEQCPIHQAYQDGKVHFGSEEVFWSKDGSRFPVEYISTPIIENKKLTGAVVVFRDLNTFV